jgi:hypothetical protein
MARKTIIITWQSWEL